MKPIVPLFAVVAAAAVAACDQPADYVLPPYVVDSGLPAAQSLGFGEVVWMDGERLLFQRREQVDGPEGPGTKRIHPITIWHTGTGKIVTHDPDPNGKVGGLCFSPVTGGFSYLHSFTEDDKSTFMVGPFITEVSPRQRRSTSWVLSPRYSKRTLWGGSKTRRPKCLSRIGRSSIPSARLPRLLNLPAG